MSPGLGGSAVGLRVLVSLSDQWGWHGLFLFFSPKPRQALLTLQVDTPQPLPPPHHGPPSQHLVGVSSELQGGGWEPGRRLRNSVGVALGL